MEGSGAYPARSGLKSDVMRRYRYQVRLECVSDSEGRSTRRAWARPARAIRVAMAHGSGAKDASP